MIVINTASAPTTFLIPTLEIDKNNGLIAYRIYHNYSKLKSPSFFFVLI